MMHRCVCSEFCSALQFVVICNKSTKPTFVIYDVCAVIYNAGHDNLQGGSCMLQRIVLQIANVALVIYNLHYTINRATNNLANYK